MYAMHVVDSDLQEVGRHHPAGLVAASGCTQLHTDSPSSSCLPISCLSPVPHLVFYFAHHLVYQFCRPSLLRPPFSTHCFFLLPPLLSGFSPYSCPVFLPFAPFPDSLFFPVFPPLIFHLWGLSFFFRQTEKKRDSGGKKRKKREPKELGNK